METCGSPFAIGNYVSVIYYRVVKKGSGSILKALFFSDLSSIIIDKKNRMIF